MAGGVEPVPSPLREQLRLRSALWDRSTGLAAFAYHMDDVRSLFEDRPAVALLHISCGDLGLLESIYGWQVLDRVLKRAAGHIDSLRGRVLSQRGIVCLFGVASEEILIFEPDCPDGGEITSDAAARVASAIASALDEAFCERAFASMTPKLHFRAGWAMIEENPHFRFERIVYRAIEVARGQTARREDRRRAEWGAELRRIIRDGDLVTTYQPVVDLMSFQVIGHEAFSGGPAGGALSEPGMMFNLSEGLGITRDLDRVCRIAAIARAQGTSAGGKVFLNTCPANFADPEWGSDALVARLREAGLTPADVVIEIPESVPADGELLRAAAVALRSRGFSLALDDVGTGQSSLTIIETIRPEYLKIDRSLVTGLEGSLVKQEVVATILQIARRIGSQLIAVGIETREDLTALRRIGAPLGQGYLFARPGPRMVAGPLPPLEEPPRSKRLPVREDS